MSFPPQIYGKYICSRCGLDLGNAGSLFTHLVEAEGWESEAAYVRCQQLIYPEEWQPDADGVLRCVREFVEAESCQS